MLLQEEVLGWDEEDSEEELEKKTKEFQKHHHIDEMGSDLEEDGEDEDDTTDDKAWGKKRRLFHGADFVGDNILGEEDLKVIIIIIFCFAHNLICRNH